MYNPFLGMFPKVRYNMSGGMYSEKEIVTNLFFRVGFLRDTLNDIGAYYQYVIQDGDKPESLADQLYNDPGAGWMIIYANQMYDPQFDWPLDYFAFQRYIAEKYRERVPASGINNIKINDGGVGYSNGYLNFIGGSGYGANAYVTVNETGKIVTANVESSGTAYYYNDVIVVSAGSLGGYGANLTVQMASPADGVVIDYALSTIHHYEKVINRRDSLNNETQETKFLIDKSIKTDGVLYLANASGTYIVGEKASINSDPDMFTGTVVQWTPSNNRLVLANTSGSLMINQYIMGANSFANGTIVRNQASYTGNYDYYDKLSVGNTTTTINIDYYTVTETVYAQAVTIYDYEKELNEKRKFIKVIKPEYYNRIRNEFKTILDEYYNDANAKSVVVPYSPLRRLT